MAFSKPPVETEATDLSHYAFETPIGRAVPFGSATVVYDPAGKTPEDYGVKGMPSS